MTNSKRYMDADWDYARLEEARHYVPMEQPERVALSARPGLRHLPTDN